MLQVVIPMAGLGSRFASYGFKTNKYLLPINIKKQPMIELAITSLNISVPCKYFFIINEENGYNENLRTLLSDICKKYGFQYEIKSVSKLTEGPASTVSIIGDIINMDQPMIVSNSDQILENWDFDNFLNMCKKYDGCVLTYEPDYPLEIGAKDKHSFVRLSDTGTVIECREKIVLSKKALVGVHYFSTAALFFNSYEYMVKRNMRAPNGEFYLSLCYQSMLENGKTVGIYDIQQYEKFCPVGEPDDYFKYLYGIGGYKNIISRLEDETILFGNGISYVKYIRTSKFIIDNPGLVMVISGDANTYNANQKSNNKKLEKYEMTNMNIVLSSECELIIIKCNEYVYNISKNMKKEIYNISDFTRGWMMGDFTPCIFKTKQFKFGLLTHNKNDERDYHYHEYSNEINVLLEGSMYVNKYKINKGDVFYIQTNQLTCPIFTQDCKVLCIKTSSVIGDKICL